MPKPKGRRRPQRPVDPFASIRRNHRIRAPKIRVVGPDGKQYGVMDTKEAFAVAKDAGLDLVEVAAQARPPVCRIMDFGKYVYEQQKKSKDSKGSSSKTKEVKFRPRVDEHDFMTKIRRAESFLHKANKVKLTLSFRGREMAHTDVGFDTIKRAIQELEHMAHLDSPPRLVGRNINVMLSPLPANKRKPKWLNLHQEAEDAHDEDDDIHEDDEHDDEIEREDIAGETKKETSE